MWKWPSFFRIVVSRFLVGFFITITAWTVVSVQRNGGFSYYSSQWVSGSFSDGARISETHSTSSYSLAHPVCFKYLTEKENDGSKCSWISLKDNFKYHTHILRNKSIAMVGDSRMRHMFNYLRSMVDKTMFVMKDTYNDTTVRNDLLNFTLNFYARWFPNHDFYDLMQKWTNMKSHHPQYVFYETGAWPVFTSEALTPETARGNLTAVAEAISKLDGKITTIWLQTLPFQPREAMANNSKWAKKQNPDLVIEKFGQASKEVATNFGIPLWTSAYEDAKNHLDLYYDPVHPGPALIRKAVCQMLLAMDTEHCDTS